MTLTNHFVTITLDESETAVPLAAGVDVQTVATQMGLDDSRGPLLITPFEQPWTCKRFSEDCPEAVSGSARAGFYRHSVMQSSCVVTMRAALTAEWPRCNSSPLASMAITCWRRCGKATERVSY